MTSSRQDRVSAGRERQRTLQTEVIGRQVFSAVTRVSEGDVGAFLALSFSSPQEKPHSSEGDQKSEDNAYGNPGIVATVY